MSKLNESLAGAEDQRELSLDNSGKKFSGYFQALKQELQEEIRWVEEAVTRRQQQEEQAALLLRVPPAPATPSTPPVKETQPPAPKHPEPIAATSGAALPVRAAAPSLRPTVAAPSAASISIQSPAQAPTPAQMAEAAKLTQHAVSPASWDQVMILVKQRLQESEQQAARHTGDAVRLTAQLNALDQLIAQLEQERVTARQRLEHTSKASALLEATKVSLSRELEALRECQLLAYEMRMAEQEIQASAAVVAHITESKLRVTDELSHYQQRSEALQERASRLRFQLAKALAETGTTDNPQQQLAGDR